MELRCDSKLHGRLVEGLIEIKCDSRFCGAGPGVVVLHQFNPLTGDFVRTERFADPARSRKEVEHVGSR